MEEFKDHVPANMDFNVGYYQGSQKICLVTSEDLNSMYSKYTQGGITLWCDGRIATETISSRNISSVDKRKRSSSSREQTEEEIDDIFYELKEKHISKYETPKLRLWSRMIASGLHTDYDTPPDIPAFTGSICKKGKKDNGHSMNEALTGAAIAFAKAINGSEASPVSSSQSSNTSYVSPSKSVDLRMKNLEQLRVLKGLLEDGILSNEEFSEQKQKILKFLAKLN